MSETELNKTASAQSHSTDGLAAALFKLVSEWEREAAFLSNPNDHPQDKEIGKTYAECAAKLRAAIGG